MKSPSASTSTAAIPIAAALDSISISISPRSPPKSKSSDASESPPELSLVTSTEPVKSVISKLPSETTPARRRVRSLEEDSTVRAESPASSPPSSNNTPTRIGAPSSSSSPSLINVRSPSKVSVPSVSNAIPAKPSISVSQLPSESMVALKLSATASSAKGVLAPRVCESPTSGSSRCQLSKPS